MKKYESIVSLNKKEFLFKLDNLKGEKLCKALLGLYEVEDWEWVQEKYLEFLYHDDILVAKAALSGLGNLARFHRQLDTKKVIGEIEKVLKENQELEGKVSDVLSDIKMFVK